MTTQLWELITGNKLTQETKAVETDEVKTISSKTATLTSEIAPGGKITAYTVDTFGRDDKKIVLGDPTTNETEYSIAGKILTFHTNVTGKVHIYYPVMKEVQVITSKPTAGENYRIESDLLCKDVDTKDTYLAKLIVPNSQIQENFSIGAANESTEPAAIPVVIDCLEDGVTGKFYEILFLEDDKQQ